MNRITPLDEAQLKHEFRQLYKNLGYPEIMQVLYEILKSAQILSEVLSEEITKEN